MNYIVWDASPTIFSIGDFQLRWYSLMFVLSFSFSLKYMKKIYEDQGKNVALLDPLFYYVISGTIIGARLGHCLLYEPEYYINNAVEILMVWKGGLASHGGAVGMLLALGFYCRKHKEALLTLLDDLSIPIALSASLIRVGNFFNSEIIGHETTVPWAIIFKRVDHYPRHPAQLYESLAYFMIFVVLISIKSKSGTKLNQGRMIGLLILCIFMVRLWIEFFKLRQESYDTTWILNTGQLLSIPFIIGGVYLCLRKNLSQSENKL